MSSDLRCFTTFEFIRLIEHSLKKYGLIKGGKSEVATELLRMPYFVVQNPNNKKVIFVEVKFRASGEFNSEDLPKSYPFTNVFVILIFQKTHKLLTCAVSY